MEASIPVIVIAHESPEKGAAIARTLEQGGYRTALVDSSKVMTALGDHSAPVLIVSVGVADPMCFELIESVRAAQLAVECKVLLIGSVHNQNAYRRNPSDSYGADDLIDETELEAEVVERVARLIDPTKALREDPAYARFRAMADVIIAEIAMQHPREVVLPEAARSEMWTRAVKAGRQRFRMALAGTKDGDVDWVGQALERLTRSLSQG